MKRLIFIGLFVILTLSACSIPAKPPLPNATPLNIQIPISISTQPIQINSIEINFNPIKKENGITLVDKQDNNQYIFDSNEDKQSISTSGFITPILTNYIYFKIIDGFYTKREPITIQIEYFDKGDGLIFLQYDSYSSTISSKDSAYRKIDLGYRLNTLKWKTASYVINDARFEHSQNEDADFRINGEVNPVIISSVKITLGGKVLTTPTPAPTAVTPAVYPSPLGDKAVFTYYFYWYDAPNGWAFNLTNAPIDYQTMSWLNVSWHLKQLQEIKNAGIDVVLPVVDYSPGDINYWQPGLVNLAKALDQMRADGTTPPAVGMFVDTTAFTGKDMREESAKNELYNNIKYFFTTIPRGYWALTQNTRPIIWFYTSNFPTAYDQTFIDYIYAHFQEDFNVRPYLVFSDTWDYPAETQNGNQVKNYNTPHLKYDASYSWGGAIAPTFSLKVAEIGPGFDDHAVEGRIPPTYSDRKNGLTYKQDFGMAIKCGSPWLAIETWSEFMEGTEISETLQYGRQYLDLTKELIPYFKAGIIPEGLDTGSFSNQNQVSYTAGETDQGNGISATPSQGDGQYISSEKEGVYVLQINGGEGSYLYFQVDNSFYFNDLKPIAFTIKYFDEGYGPIDLDYDTAKCGSAFDAATMYKRVTVAYLKNSLTWKSATININDASFVDSENWGSDFRLLSLGKSPLSISEVEIQKQPKAEE